MDSAPIIRDGDEYDLATLTQSLSDSFANDPMLNWVIPQPDLYPIFFNSIIQNIFLPKGIVHMEDQGRGAALWLPPGESYEMPPSVNMVRMVLKLMLKKGPAPLFRIHRQGGLFARHHPRDPHYYLQFIGARQRDQGRGIGSALLKHGTRICDQEGMPAYLESSNILNVPLYERHGFEVIDKQVVPGGGPTAWFMWREPR
jgi:GNAT superfamily N-acetyltransferase